MSHAQLVTDWAAMLDDLRRRGLSSYTLAQALGIPRTTLFHYREQGGQPRHAEGDRIIEFWCSVTSSERTQVPQCTPVYSAARAY